MRHVISGLLCVGLVSACSQERHGPGTLPVVDFASNPQVDGGGGDTCSDAAKLVYLVDANNDFLSFKPDTVTFTKIGSLNCPAQFGATPFSMGVDRSPT